MTIEDVEQLRRYGPEGYHPIVVHRLGTAEEDTGPHPGKAMIPRVLDEFVISGPNGKHRCFVTAPARMSLALAKDASATRIFQPTVARAIAAQLIEAVVFLHTQGVVHAGVWISPQFLLLSIQTSCFVDLHPGNILLRLPETLNTLSLDQLYRKFGYPEAEPVVRLDGRRLCNSVPTHGIMSM